MVVPKYIDEILNWFSMETPRKGSCRMEEVGARLSVSQHLMSKAHEHFCNHVRHAMHTNQICRML